MPLLKQFARLTLALAVAPLLGGCWASVFAIPTPSLSDSASLRELTKPVPVYEGAPCWMQQEWSADNSRKATARAGNPVAYTAPCVFDKQKASTPTAQPGTS